MSKQITVPQLGESVTEATVATWFKQVGDQVKEDEVIAELETDKVTLEVNAPCDGVIAKLHVAEGDTVAVDQLIAELDEQAAESGAETEAETEAETAADSQDAAQDNGQDTMAPAEFSEAETDGIDTAIDTESEPFTTNDDGPKSFADTIETEIAKSDTDAPDSSATDSKEVDATPESPVADEEIKSPELISGVDGSGNKLSPAVAKLAAERGLDLADKTGSGKDGRVTKADILENNLIDASLPAKAERPSPAATAQPQPRPTPVPSKPKVKSGALEERVKMTKLRKVIASRLKTSQETNATLATFNEIDMANVIAMRSKYKSEFEHHHQVKLGFMSFFVKATTIALQEYPNLNAEIDGDEIVYKNYYHVGVAVGTDAGLVVPVVRDADAKSLAEIEAEIIAFADKARNNQLAIDDLSGGTFSITNGGIYGSMLSTPIINPPQSGILGMHAITKRPVVVEDRIEIRPVMYVALSYDHRLIDGKDAVQFLVRIKQLLENPERILFNL